MDDYHDMIYLSRTNRCCKRSFDPLMMVGRIKEMRDNDFCSVKHEYFVLKYPYWDTAHGKSKHVIKYNGSTGVDFYVEEDIMFVGGRKRGEYKIVKHNYVKSYYPYYILKYREETGIYHDDQKQGMVKVYKEIISLKGTLIRKANYLLNYVLGVKHGKSIKHKSTGKTVVLFYSAGFCKKKIKYESFEYFTKLYYIKLYGWGETKILLPNINIG
jgi:hypothetical protein